MPAITFVGKQTFERVPDHRLHFWDDDHQRVTIERLAGKCLLRQCKRIAQTGSTRVSCLRQVFAPGEGLFESADLLVDGFHLALNQVLALCVNRRCRARGSSGIYGNEGLHRVAKQPDAGARSGLPMAKAPTSARTRLRFFNVNTGCAISERTPSMVSGVATPPSSPIHLSRTRGSE